MPWERACAFSPLLLPACCMLHRTAGTLTQPAYLHACLPACACTFLAQMMVSKCDKVLEGLQAFPQRSF